MSWPAYSPLSLPVFEYYNHIFHAHYTLTYGAKGLHSNVHPFMVGLLVQLHMDTCMHTLNLLIYEYIYTYMYVASGFSEFAACIW